MFFHQSDTVEVWYHEQIRDLIREMDSWEIPILSCTDPNAKQSCIVHITHSTLSQWNVLFEDFKALYKNGVTFYLEFQNLPSVPTPVFGGVCIPLVFVHKFLHNCNTIILCCIVCICCNLYSCYNNAFLPCLAAHPCISQCFHLALCNYSTSLCLVRF